MKRPQKLICSLAAVVRRLSRDAPDCTCSAPCSCSLHTAPLESRTEELLVANREYATNCSTGGLARLAHSMLSCRLRALFQDRSPTIAALVAFKLVCFSHEGAVSGKLRDLTIRCSTGGLARLAPSMLPCRLRALIQDRPPTAAALVAFDTVCLAHVGAVSGE